MNEYQYDRKTVSAGIVHFGVGNFHRAHLQYYNNLLLEYGDQRKWGVYGAMIMPADGTLYNMLKRDDGIYELTVCYPSGARNIHRIGSLIGLCWGEENPEPIIEQIASPNIKIITLTITEGGYILKSNAESERHKTVFWYVAEGLRRRMAADLPITILSCDNLQHNGDTAAKSFFSYFDAMYPDVAVWARENVTFPNSMVDRITPATRSGKITDVYCEDFIQWVVEDKFIAGRPAWERVGVHFTNDVTPYENMKLSLLNASHSLLCYPAYLEGFKKVDVVLADSRYRTMIKDFMNVDVTPYVPVPEGVDLDDYKETLLRRFSNTAVSDQVSRLCGDGIAKFAVYIVPTLRKMLVDGKDTRRLAFLLASYYKYLKYERTESGEKIEIFEPHITAKDKEILAGESTIRFFELSPFAELSLSNYPKFVDQYKYFVEHSVGEGLDLATVLGK
ncbi:MAG: mannitol dehydrogenase family protein [Bacteroidales bacterium]|nr:mannitol dehydrogenase family protein [Bacteroidales bacterium]MDD3521324.1 mannitol dehydrogenase family protein [Bacteroidales bacterium]MDD4030612.1 mannitol dehydrogenase family protein [Bacteroidales bacterium]MDD4434699.1 mannitol dehydrogenase family protein [Bacteroidales bacterium]MDD5732189.1 mannitol dehydrogenase family protein [Bacteroidales bacterium]